MFVGCIAAKRRKDMYGGLEATGSEGEDEIINIEQK